MNIDGIVHSKGVTGYTITDSSTGQNLLSFDSSNNLQSSSKLYSNIFSTVDQLNATCLSLIQNNTNSVTALQNTVENMQNQGGQPQSLSSVLSIGSDAGNRSISGVNVLTATSLSVGGVYVGTNGDKVVIPNLQTAQVLATQIFIDNQDVNARLATIENYINNLKSFFTVLSQACEIKDNNGNNYDFSNLTQ